MISWPYFYFAHIIQPRYLQSIIWWWRYNIPFPRWSRFRFPVRQYGTFSGITVKPDREKIPGFIHLPSHRWHKWCCHKKSAPYHQPDVYRLGLWPEPDNKCGMPAVTEPMRFRYWSSATNRRSAKRLARQTTCHWYFITEIIHRPCRGWKEKPFCTESGCRSRWVASCCAH